MKKQHIIKLVAFTTILMGLALLGCNKKDDKPNPYNPQEIPLQVVKADAVYAHAGGTGSIQMNSNNFSVKVDADWVQIKPLGERIELTVSPNNTPHLRTALIIIKDNECEREQGHQQQVSISQTGITDILNADNITSSWKGTTATIDLSQLTNTPTITLLPKGNDWVKTTVNDKQLDIEVVPGQKDRKGSIIIEAGLLKKEIIINQQVGYEDLLGEYDASYTLKFGASETKNETWTLEKLEAGKSFILKGFALDLIATWNAETRTIAINGGEQKLKSNKKGTVLAAWMAEENGAGELAWSSKHSFVAPLDTSKEKPTFTFTFKPNGEKFIIEVNGKNTEVFPKGWISWNATKQPNGEEYTTSGKSSRVVNLVLTKK